MVDSEAKRRSVSGYSGLVIAPVPDAAIANVDRAHETGLYALVANLPAAIGYFAGLLTQRTLTKAGM